MLDQSTLSQLKQLKKDIHDSVPRGTGTVKATTKRFGFVIDDKDGQQYLLPQEQMERVLPGDKIDFTLKAGNNAEDKPVATIEKFISSTFKNFIGQVRVKNNNMFVIPESNGYARWIFIPPKFRRNYSDGDIVSAIITQHPFKAKGRVQAEIKSLIGKPEDPFIEHAYAIASNFIPVKSWDSDELEAIRQTGERYIAENKHALEDLTAVPFVTIDGANTQDLDDAIYCEATDNGWKVLIAIADPSSFIEEGSIIDKSAAALGATVYLPAQKISMLPETLASDICSLKPDMERFSITVEITIGKDGSINNTEFHHALIKSHGKLSYEQVAEFLDGGKSTLDDNLQKSLTDALSLMQARKTWRKEQALETEDYPDYRLNLDDKGKIESIERMDRNTAQTLVEELMLTCNECVAAYVMNKVSTGLFWSHAGFKKDQLSGVNKILENYLPEIPSETVTSLTGYIDLIKASQDADADLPLKDILKKKLARSEWTSSPLPHFGLGLSAYTTFTSPLRKYADLLNHRLIKQLAFDKKCKAINERTVTQLNLSTQAVRNTQRDCELSLKCEHLSKRIGNTLEGEISLINHKNIGIYLKDFDVHGHIEVRSLPKQYKFKQDTLQLISDDDTYQLTQKIDVIVDSVDTKGRRIKLALASSGEKAQ